MAKPRSKQPAAEFRAGFCAIIGRPNVGKSTFLNRALGEKLAAVTPKPQTTRNRIMGVKNMPGAQIVYVDTPGIHRAQSSLNKYMVEQALGAAAECDVVLLITEAPRTAPGKLATRFSPGEGVEAILEALAKIQKPRLLGVNKIDLLRDKHGLLPVLEGFAKLLPFDEIMPMSAATGENVDTLEAAIAKRLPVGERLYPEEMLTDRAERFLAAELVREQVFLLLEQELPYSTAVTIEQFQERQATKGDVMIDANIHVERESQKKIVIGEGGRMVKEIGMRARAEIARLLGCPVHLRLFVKVDPDWTTKQSSLKRLGYE
jgi:GTP-binding protein Era